MLEGRHMKLVQVFNLETKEVITSIEETEEGIIGITKDGYQVRVDGKDLKNENSLHTETLAKE